VNSPSLRDAKKMREAIVKTKARVEQQQKRNNDKLGLLKDLPWSDLVQLHISLRLRLEELEAAGLS
jgi:hypothetical protein